MHRHHHHHQQQAPGAAEQGRRNNSGSGTRNNPESTGHNQQKNINNDNNNEGTSDGAESNADGEEVRFLSERATDSSSTPAPITIEGVEVSDVGSPEIFGGGISYPVIPKTSVARTPDSDDERTTKRSSEVLNEQQQQQQPDEFMENQSQNLNATSSASTPGTSSTMSSNADTRPPKKRFIQMSDVARIRPLHNQPSAFVEPLKTVQFPSGEQFQQAMNQWEWVQVDGLKMPVIFRGTDRYAAVHIVQLKLLSKFPPNIPLEMATKFMMISHKMLPVEAWIFNTINAVICKFDLGCQLFTPNDEVVRLADVERFYWSVKALNLNRMIEIYNLELRNAASTHLIAAITQMRNHVESDLQEVEKELLKAQANATANTAANFASPGSVR